MNCDFCCRGDAQDLDISTQIIDAALDKVKDYEIYTIRITGGEPFLNKKGLIYLIKEIISKNIMIMEFFMFTNGTIIDSEIKEALIAIGQHCKKCSDSDYGKRMKEWTKNTLRKSYNTHSYSTVIISTIGHKDVDINRVLNFYKYNEEQSVLCSYNQNTKFNNPINNESVIEIKLEGNAYKNYDKLRNNGQYKFSFASNKYCLIDDSNIFENGYFDIFKTLTVSSNGNVFAGCSQSYENLDRENICNILKCKDLFKCIDSYSWKYPLLSGQNDSLNRWLTNKWNYEHGINSEEYSDCVGDIEANDMYMLMTQSIKTMYDLEDTIKYVHKKYPYFTHYQAVVMATYSKALRWYDEIDDKDKKILYLQIYSGAENPDMFKNITREEIEKTCKDLFNIYKHHILNNDPICRFLYKIGVL